MRQYILHIYRSVAIGTFYLGVVFHGFIRYKRFTINPSLQTKGYRDNLNLESGAFLLTTNKRRRLAELKTLSYAQLGL
jgi:hypothetical protein